MPLGGRLPFGLGEVVEGVHELGGGVYAVDVHVRRDVQEDIGVVEDHPDVGVDHQVGDVLGGCGRGGDDADDLLGLRNALLELVYVLDDDVAHGAPALPRAVVAGVGEEGGAR